MKTCGEGCIPICDFCKYCIHKEYEGETGAPIGCEKHPDKFSIAWYCEDFHCFRCEE